jgi:hypothetical protein
MYMQKNLFDSLYTITEEIPEANVSMGYVGSLNPSWFSNTDRPHESPLWVTVIDSSIRTHKTEQKALNTYQDALRGILEQMGQDAINDESPW